MPPDRERRPDPSPSAAVVHTNDTTSLLAQPSNRADAIVWATRQLEASTDLAVRSAWFAVRSGLEAPR